MILLQSGSNNVVVTLNEKKTLSNPTYVFLFENDATRQRFACYTTDVSGFPERFNKFVITVQANPTWSSGQVELGDYGFYHYYVYETNSVPALNTFLNADLRDMIPTYFTSLVEQGKMKYKTTDTSISSYADNASSIKSYGS